MEKFRDKWNKLHGRSERDVAVLFNKLLSKQIRAIAATASKDGVNAALGKVDRLIQRDDFKTLYEEIYLKVGYSYYLLQKSELEQMKRLPTVGLGFFSDIWRMYIEEALLKKIIAERITQVSELTKEKVRTALSFAGSQGLAKQDVAKYLREQMPMFSANRSKVIARTETTHAASIGQKFAADTSTLELEKVWVSLSFDDGRIRADHLAANDQRVPKNGTFNVGGVQMEYPGDPAGGASNCANCRCGIAYVVKGFES
jgi:hypothetical protein